MAVDFLRVLLLQAENDLTRNNTLVRVSEAEVWVECEGGSVFEDMSGDVLVLDTGFHDAVLVDTSKRVVSCAKKGVERLRDHSNVTSI